MSEWFFPQHFVGTTLVWGNTSNRKQVGFQKHRLSHFSPPGLSIKASWILDYVSILTVVVTPSSFRLFSSRLEPRIIEILSLMYTSQTQSWKMCSFRWHLIPHGLKTIFSMLAASLSVRLSRTVFNAWNCLLLLQICRGRERKCLFTVNLRCSNFNSSFKYFSQVSHITRLVFLL